MEQSLPHPDRHRGYLDELVLSYPLDSRLQRDLTRRLQLDGLVAGMGSDVGQLLALGGIDRQVIAAAVEAETRAVVVVPRRLRWWLQVGMTRRLGQWLPVVMPQR